MTPAMALRSPTTLSATTEPPAITENADVLVRKEHQHPRLRCPPQENPATTETGDPAATPEIHTKVSDLHHKNPKQIDDNRN